MPGLERRNVQRRRKSHVVRRGCAPVGTIFQGAAHGTREQIAGVVAGFSDFPTIRRNVLGRCREVDQIARFVEKGIDGRRQINIEKSREPQAGKGCAAGIGDLPCPCGVPACPWRHSKSGCQAKTVHVIDHRRQAPILGALAPRCHEHAQPFIRMGLCMGCMQGTQTRAAKNKGTLCILDWSGSQANIHTGMHTFSFMTAGNVHQLRYIL